mmetsp:Transcript_63490/g.176602  ORF Transcript_63490/g.176602 Transcript_63490/m.176602 type:complete len:228 (-) Transcript_63490:1227-1910(-)
MCFRWCRPHSRRRRRRPCRRCRSSRAMARRRPRPWGPKLLSLHGLPLLLRHLERLLRLPRLRMLLVLILVLGLLLLRLLLLRLRLRLWLRPQMRLQPRLLLLRLLLLLLQILISIGGHGPRHWQRGAGATGMGLRLHLLNACSGDIWGLRRSLGRGTRQGWCSWGRRALRCERCTCGVRLGTHALQNGATHRTLLLRQWRRMPLRRRWRGRRHKWLRERRRGAYRWR